MSTTTTESKTIKICTELDSPTPRLAAEKAFQTNVRNIPAFGIPQAFGLAMMRGRYWKPGSTVTVKFLNGSTKQKAKARATAKEWENYANIKFKFISSGKADIRIGFKYKGDEGSWSYIGTDALDIPQNEPTMNFGWLYDNTEQEEYNRVVLHEFGHALGAIHEHQNPSVNIPWDKPAVYAYYARTNGWDKATVDNNIFAKYSKKQTQYTAFDKTSIMLYAIPNELTIGDYEVGFNTELSPTDKIFIGICYPFSIKSPVRLPLNGYVNGRIALIGEDDFYIFTVVKDNTTVTVQTSGTVDTILSVIDAKSLQILSWNDDFGGLKTSKVVLKLNKGDYYARVRQYAGVGTGDYTISTTAGNVIGSTADNNNNIIHITTNNTATTTASNWYKIN